LLYLIASASVLSAILPGVPEIDPATGSSALTLLAGVALIIRALRR